VKIRDGQVVSIHYTLKLANGEVVDSSDGGDPLEYLQGAGNIVLGLERELEGHEVGDRLTAVVQPGDGYGTRDEDALQSVPRSAFPDDIEIEPGMQFFAHLPEGGEQAIWVVAADDQTVTVDPNHPLAGEVLHFAVEVTSIRAATAEEMEHGHPHGPDGHGHHHEH
jgi:FKBP-type peptidyl-prolyl cis-trans isomerase SlyD